MKLTLFFLLAAFALAASSPVPAEPIEILRSDFEIQPDGAYMFGFETENKINRVKRGSYSYLDPEGHPITVTFFADETGFQAEGAHLPIAPVV